MNTSKTILASTAVVLALALVLAPLVLSDALATKNKKSNFAEQIISQVQKSNQKSQVVSGDQFESSIHKCPKVIARA